MSNLPNCFTLNWSGWYAMDADCASTTLFRETSTDFMCSVTQEPDGLFAFVAIDPNTVKVCTFARGSEGEMLSVSNIFAKEHGGWIP